MTTTSLFQKYPDYYNSQEECIEFQKNYNKEKSNPRYKNFKQINFTAGDEEQFNKYKYDKNNKEEILVEDIKLSNNLFLEYKLFTKWEKYKNLDAISVTNTFKYIFNKFKKGIFVKIVNNKLKVFLPFSNVNFVNEWSNNIKIDPKYGNIYNFFSHISKLEERRFIKSMVNNFINTWYSNNCLLRHEYPIGENDTNISCLKNMLEELCEKRIIPDIEFFINKRDFPLLSKNDFEPYYHLWDSKKIPLVSHKYNKYCPILSMSSNIEDFTDILLPCHDDWIRVQNYENKWFPFSRQKDIYNFNTKWEDKKNIAIFRGSSTGSGVTIKTNQRLNIAYLSTIFPNDENNIPYLDAGITKWNVRPRKIMGEKYLQTIDIDSIPFKLVDSITPNIQSTYKYIVHIDGHTSAFRLSYQLNMNSVLLIVKSEWKIWYRDMLKEYIHFIPVKEDLSDLLDKIKWCRNNDDKCKEIANNARNFYNKYLQKEGILDYCQKLFIDIKRDVGYYKYNNINPLDIQLKFEYNIIKNKNFYIYPKTLKNIENIENIPTINRCYSLLRGIHYILNMCRNNKYKNILNQKGTLLFENKLSIIKKYNIANFSINIKSTNDSEKIKEHIHETFVGLNCINNICKEIPNFSYNFGMYKQDNFYNIISENIDGITFQQYIKSDEFCFKDYLYILLQICAALEYAQKKYTFVHNDLTIWNIIILKTKEPVEVKYLLSSKKIIKIETNMIPVIIDYGKSHVIYENFHYGIINMYNFSTIRDILSILITSIYQIVIDKKLERNDFCNLLKLSNFISNTKFCKNIFKNSKDIKDFFHNAKKYSNLITMDKFELENYTPMDLFDYILKMNYDFKISYPIYYNSYMNIGNENQVFDYILANTFDEKIESYINIFKKILNININKIDSIFDLYFIKEVEKSMILLKKDMCNFIKDEKLDCSKYIEYFNTAYNFIINISIDSNFSIEYSQNNNKYNNIIYNEITPDIFTFPEKIKGIIKISKLDNSKLFYIKVKFILESLLCELDTYNILKNNSLSYKKILDIKEKNIIYNYANINTVKIISKFL